MTRCERRLLKAVKEIMDSIFDRLAYRRQLRAASVAYPLPHISGRSRQTIYTRPYNGPSNVTR